MINHSREQNPEKSKELFKQGMEMRMKIQREKELELFIESYECDHSNLDAIKRVVGAGDDVDIDDKIIILERSIKLYPKEYTLYMDLGMYYEMKKDYENAIIIYGLLKLRNPDYYPVYKYLALLYSEIGELEKAFDCIQTGIERFPKDGYLWHALGSIFLRNDFYHEYYLALKKVVEIGDSNAELAMMYLDQCSDTMANLNLPKDSPITPFLSYLNQKE